VKSLNEIRECLREIKSPNLVTLISPLSWDQNGDEILPIQTLENVLNVAGRYIWSYPELMGFLDETLQSSPLIRHQLSKLNNNVSFANTFKLY
jgi:hypothetical protein